MSWYLTGGVQDVCVCVCVWDKPAYLPQYPGVSVIPVGLWKKHYNPKLMGTKVYLKNTHKTFLYTLHKWQVMGHLNKFGLKTPHREMTYSDYHNLLPPNFRCVKHIISSNYCYILNNVSQLFVIFRNTTASSLSSLSSSTSSLTNEKFAFTDYSIAPRTCIYKCI